MFFYSIRQGLARSLYPPKIAPGRLGSMPQRVVVIGAGLAGLTAAVALAGRGFRLRVLESRKWR